MTWVAPQGPSVSVESPRVAGGRSSAVAVAMVSRVLGMVSVYATAFVISRRLGAGALGAYSSGLAIVTLGSIPAKLGLDFVALKVVPGLVENRDWDAVARVRRLSLSIACSVGGAGALALFVSAPFVSERLFNDPSLTATVRWSALGIVPLAVFNITAALLSGLRRLSLFGVVRFALVQVTTLAMIGGAVLLGSNATLIRWYVGALVVALATTSVAVWRAMRSARGLERSPARDDTATVRQTEVSVTSLLRLSLQLALISSTYVVFEWADSLIILRYLGDDALGVYQGAYRMASILGTPVAVLSAIVASRFALLYEENEIDRLQSLVRRTALQIGAMIVPASLILLVAPSQLLSIFGPEFRTADTTLRLLALAQMTALLAGPAIVLLSMAGSHKVVSLLLLGVLAINVASNFVVVPSFGLEGAALVQLVSLVILNGGGALLCVRVLGFWPGVQRLPRRET